MSWAERIAAGLVALGLGIVGSGIAAWYASWGFIPISCACLLAAAGLTAYASWRRRANSTIATNLAMRHENNIAEANIRPGGESDIRVKVRIVNGNAHPVTVSVVRADVLVGGVTIRPRVEPVRWSVPSDAGRSPNAQGAWHEIVLRPDADRTAAIAKVGNGRPEAAIVVSTFVESSGVAVAADHSLDPIILLIQGVPNVTS